MQFCDQTGHIVELPGLPRRIVSLVPSQTELLFDLGVGDRVAGVTLYCTHPDPMPEHVVRIGGTKKVHMERLRSLSPDLILGNKEENTREQIEILRQEFPTWISDIVSLNDAIQMIEQVSKMTRSERGERLTADIRKSLFHQNRTLRKAVYLIWYNPIMTAAGGTFIHTMLPYAGFTNAVGDKSRYPVLTWDELRNAEPEVILLSSEPFAFDESHVAEFRSLCPGAEVLLVDGTYFSWYGSRLAKAAEYFRQLTA